MNIFDIESKYYNYVCEYIYYGRVCIRIRRQPDVLRAIDWPTRRRCPAEDGSVAGPAVVCQTGVYAAECPRATPPNPPPDLRHWTSDGGSTSPLVLRPLCFRSGVVSAGGAMSAGRTDSRTFPSPPSVPDYPLYPLTHPQNAHALSVYYDILLYYYLYRYYTATAMCYIHIHTNSEVFVITANGLWHVYINYLSTFTMYIITI